MREWRREPATYVGITTLALLTSAFVMLTLSSRGEGSVSVLPSSEATSTTGVVLAPLPKEAPATPAPAAAAPKPRVESPRAEPLPASSTPKAPDITGELNLAAGALRAALVNVLCYAPAGSRIRSISGTGVIVDQKGIVLTNAHIAQFLLLEDAGVNCVIRTGSPAVERYTAKLIYIPTQWVRDNAAFITAQNPSGTGERDFAFLVITGSTRGEALPSAFPALPLAPHWPTAASPVVIGSYGAQFLASSEILSAHYPIIVYGVIRELLTFDRNTADVINLGGSVAAQEGSSGGGIVGVEGTLLGTITTSTTVGETASRTLTAITTSYIRGEYAGATGEALELLLARPPRASIEAFAATASELAGLLKAELR